jgi:hypothetical protein
MITKRIKISALAKMLTFKDIISSIVQLQITSYSCPYSLSQQVLLTMSRIKSNHAHAPALRVLQF